MSQRVFDEDGHVITVSSDIPVNDLTRAPVFMDAMPDGVLYIPVVIAAADGETPRMALLNPTLIATTEEATKITVQAVNEARQGLVDSLVAEGVQRDQLQQQMIDANTAQNQTLASQQQALQDMDARLAAAVAALELRPTMVKLGEVNIAFTATIAVGASSRPITTNLNGILATDRLVLYTKSALPSGYALSAGVRANAGSLTVNVTHPALALSAGFSIPTEVWALR